MITQTRLQKIITQTKNLDKTGCINFSDKTQHNDKDNTGNDVDRGKTKKGSQERITKTKKSLRQTSRNDHSEQSSILITDESAHCTMITLTTQRTNKITIDHQDKLRQDQKMRTRDNSMSTLARDNFIQKKIRDDHSDKISHEIMQYKIS